MYAVQFSDARGDFSESMILSCEGILLSAVMFDVILSPSSVEQSISKHTACFVVSCIRADEGRSSDQMIIGWYSSCIICSRHWLMRFLSAQDDDLRGEDCSLLGKAKVKPSVWELSEL